MKRGTCPQEESVLNAIHTGAWEDSVACHAAQCESCRDIIKACRWLQTLAASTSAAAVALPDPSLLWWRAQLAERDSEFATTRRAAEWLRMVPSALVCLSLLLWIAWSWRAFENALAWLSSDVWSRIVVAAYLLLPSAPTFLWPAVGAALLVIAFLAYPLVERT
jgi:hypothetical protein